MPRALFVDTETIFSTSHPWFTAEQLVGDKPLMFRGRQIPDKFIGDSSLSNLLVISLSFDVTESTGLPSPAHYKMIDDLERQHFDPLEVAQLGIIAFIKTHDGLVQYFVYVSNVDAASDALEGISIASGHVELATAHDPNWNEYKAFLRGMHHN